MPIQIPEHLRLKRKRIEKLESEKANLLKEIEELKKKVKEKAEALHGENAIKALYDVVAELEEQRGTELTDKQTSALIRIMKALISHAEERLCSRDFRSYWRAPRLAHQLSKEQREKVTEKFLELVKENKEKTQTK